MDFSENMDSVKDFISKQKADGGRDFPEDVQGGFHKALGMNWEAGSIRSIFHIADALDNNGLQVLPGNPTRLST